MSSKAFAQRPVINLNASLQEAIATGKALVLTLGKDGYVNFSIKETPTT